MRRKAENNMKLKQLTERIWYYPYEEKRDRPNLIYIRGGRWSLAVTPSMSQDEYGQADGRNYLCALYSARYWSLP